MTTQQKSTLNRKVIIGIVAIVVILGATGGYYFWYLPVQQAEEAKRLVEEAYKKKLALIPHPDTFVHHVIGDPQFLDPAVAYETSGGYIILNVYETLIFFKGGSAAKLEPLLAEEMPTISDGGKTYTFKLRKNVKFHDGTLFNAKAVKYSIDRMIIINEADGPSWMYDKILGAEKYMASKMTEADMKEYLSAGGVEVVDDYTVRVKLDRPYAPMLYIFAFSGACIVSPTAVEQHGGVAPGKHNEWMDKNMVGTGPYKFVEWVPRQRVVIEAFDGYWRAPAKIKRAIIQTVPELGARELALFTGEADAVGIPAANIFDIVQKDPWIKERKVVLRTDLQLKPPGTTITVHAAYPMFSITYIGMNVRFKPLDNIDFRYGMSYAFDYKTFINEVQNGFGELPKGCIPKGMFGFDENVFTFSLDPAKAKEYFLKAKAAGAYQDGLKLEYYYNAGNEVRRRAGLLLKDSIDKLNVGFTIDVQELDWPTFLAKTRQGTAPLFCVGWIVDYADPHDFALPFGHSTQGTLAKRVGLNIPGLDEKIMKAAEMTDLTERQKAYTEIVNIMNKEARYIWLVQPTNYFAVRDWVQVTIDPELKIPDQANPMFYGYYLYTMWKGYPPPSTK